jgi:tripartite-type tricarboxylate transporter receptor subunit TctC
VKNGIGYVLACALATALAGSHVAAQEFPSKPIRVVVPAGTGATADLVARIVGDRMSQGLGQSWVVEARPGASGLIGTQFVAKAPPDGHTLLVFSNTFIMMPSLIENIPIDIFKDIAPVGIIVSVPNVLVVHPDLRVKTLAEFLALARERPQGIDYGSPATGSAAHLIMELLSQRAKVKLTHIPFRGPQQAMLETIAGRVPASMTGAANLLPHIGSKALVPLAIADTRRSPLLPDVPTFEEQGITGMNLWVWFGMFTTGGTPPKVIERLNAELNTALKDPGVVEKLSKGGFDPVGGTPEQFMHVMERERPIYGKLISDLGLKAQ